MPEVRLVTTAEDMERCYAIRMEVFVEEQAVPPELELDEADKTAKHVLIVIGGDPAGTARLLLDTPNPGEAKIGRVAVRSTFRGRGLASKLMSFLEAEAVKERQARVTLDAQVAVIPMYEKLGYEAYGPVFDDAGIDHRKMTKRL